MTLADTIPVDSWDRYSARYPWPSVCPEGVSIGASDFSGRTATLILERLQLLELPSPLVLCLGAWTGAIVRYVAAACRSCRIIAADSWIGWSGGDKLPKLFDTFAATVWTYRRRVIPMRTTPHSAILDLARERLRPDLVLYQPTSSPGGVYNLLHTLLHQFRGVPVIGEGYDGLLESQVNAAAAECRMILDLYPPAWALVEGAPG
jgi:hypothetical protein